MSSPIQRFWRWYERHHQLYLGVTTALFLWQLVHLIWLTTDVVLVRLFGTMPLLTSPAARLALAVADYTEVPALIGTSIIYLRDILNGRERSKAWFYLFLLNTQWIHLFWITDEIVVDAFTGHALTTLPFWASWSAIAIDYLELPVMAATLRRWLRSLVRSPA